ncbi:MAG: S1C family serine protease, partial [Thermoproteota archaeon]|nr:S1C family serine protease [Thermoproteota archaeon]
MLRNVREKKIRMKIFTGILTSILLAQGIVAHTNGFAQVSPNISSFEQEQQHETNNLTQDPTKILTDIFKQTQNSTVQIKSTMPDNREVVIINGNPIGRNNVALGSGFVYDTQGHIVTNNHVVSGANKVEVTFVDGNTYSAKVIGVDPYTDLAVLLITDNNFSPNMAGPLIIGNSSTLQPGEAVAAIGNPFGLYGSITEG